MIDQQTDRAYFDWPVRVYYEDTDSGGVVYYANYLKFMERARTEWLRYSGVEQSGLRAEAGAVFMVRSARLDYLRPARFDDLLTVRTRVGRARRASLVFDQRITPAGQPEQTLCRGEIEIVYVDEASGRPRPMPRLHLRGQEG